MALPRSGPYTPRATVVLPDSWQISHSILEQLNATAKPRQQVLIDETLPANIHSPLLLVIHGMTQQNGTQPTLYVWRDLDSRWSVYRPDQPYNERADGLAAVNHELNQYEAAAQKIAAAGAQGLLERAASDPRAWEHLIRQRQSLRNLGRVASDLRALMQAQRIPHDRAIHAMTARVHHLADHYDRLASQLEWALGQRTLRTSRSVQALLYPLFPLLMISLLFETGLVQQLGSQLPMVEPLLFTIGAWLVALAVGTIIYAIVRRSTNRVPRQRTTSPASRPAPAAKDPVYQVTPSSAAAAPTATSHAQPFHRRGTSSAASPLQAEMKQYELSQQ